MFTGIVQHLGRVAAFESKPFGAALAVDSCDWSHVPQIGDSIAVNGCCLTVCRMTDGGGLHFDVIQQTLAATTLGRLRPGDAINLEHAVTPQTLLGGHVMQGHVDGIGEVVSIARDEFEHRVRIQPKDASLMECIVAKGSIAVNGVSLTIAATAGEWFEIALIPTTLQLTNLGGLQIGDRVNLETDYLAKIVVNWLRRVRSERPENA